LAGKAICDSNQAFFDVACRVEDLWIGGFSLNYLWIHERNLSSAVYFLDDYVAWQKQACPSISIKHCLRKVRVAGAEDQLFWPVDVELLFQHGLYIDLGEYPEAFFG
jgi:hypothetical protein